MEHTQAPLTTNLRTITLADFRYTLDWFGTYFDTTIRDSPSGGFVFAVKISNPLEQTVSAWEIFSFISAVSPLLEKICY